MDISGALNNTIDLSHQLSLGDDDVFYKSAKKRKSSRPHNLNLSSKKRKKVVSSKISNSSIGSISKDSLRVKNKHLALEVQKAKIVLSELNRQYVALQQKNQEAWVIVRRKRQEVNEVQNYINTEATNRIRKNLKVVNGVVREFMSGLFEDVMYKRIEKELEENQFYDHKEGDVFNNIYNDNDLLEQPLAENIEPTDEAVEERLSRKIRRSSFMYDVRGSDEHNSRRLGCTVAQKTKDKDITASSCDGLQSDNNCEMNKSLTLSDDKEVFEAIPIMMLSPENDNNNFSDIDATVISNSPSSPPTYNKLNTPIVKSFSQGFKSQNRFPSRKPNFSISGEKNSKEERELKHSVKANNPTQTKKILLSSRDREKNFNVREMFMPKPKTKSKNRSKTKVTLSNSESSIQTGAENKCIFDFDGESPFILSSKTKPGTTLDEASLDSPKTGRSKKKNPRTDNDDPTFESPGKVKSKSRSKKKYKDQDDDDEDFVIPMKQVISDGNESDVKSGLRSRSRCRVQKDVPKDLTEHSSNSEDGTDVKSPDKSTLYTGRSRSKGKSIITNNKTDKSPAFSEACSDPIGKKALGIHLDLSTNIFVDGQCESSYKSKSKNDQKFMEPSTLYSVPTKVDSPDLPLKGRERSRSRGRPKKRNSDEEKAVDQTSKKRGRSRSNGKVNGKLSMESNASPTSKGKETSGIASDVDKTTDGLVPEVPSGGSRNSCSRSRARKENKIESTLLSSPVSKEGNGMSSVTDRPKTNNLTTINRYDEYSMPTQTNSPDSKLSLQRKGRSRSRGKQNKEGSTIQEALTTVNNSDDSPTKSSSAESRISLERNGRSSRVERSSSSSRLKEECLTKERKTDASDVYSISLNTSSPEYKASLGRRGRSRSRSRPNKKGSTSNVSDLFSLPLKTNSPESPSSSRLKKEGAKISRKIDVSSPLRTKSPESPHSKQSRKSRGRSQRKSIHMSETITEGKKSDTSEVYSIPLNIESPRAKGLLFSRSRSKGRPKKEDSSMETDKDVSELYTIPLKNSSPDMKQSEKGALRRGRSRSRGRPKKESSKTDSISNQPHENIASSNEEPPSPGSLTQPISNRPDQEEENSPFTIKTICERGMESSYSLEPEPSLKKRKRSQSRGRSKGQVLSGVSSVPMRVESPDSNSSKMNSTKSRSKNREIKRTSETRKSTSDTLGVYRSIQSAAPSCHQNINRKESKSRRSKYESSGQKQSEYNLESDEDEFCQVFNHLSGNSSSNSKISSFKSDTSKKNAPDILSKKIYNHTPDEPQIQIVIEDTETIAENACTYDRLGKKFDMVTASFSKSNEIVNNDPLAVPIYSAPVKMTSPEKKTSHRRGRSRSRGRTNPKERPSQDYNLNSEVCDVYSVTAKTDSPKSTSTEHKNRHSRSEIRLHPTNKVLIDSVNLDSLDPTRSSETNFNNSHIIDKDITEKENLSPVKTKSPNSPISNPKDTPKSVSRNSSSHTHNLSSKRKRKLEEYESDQPQECKKIKDQTDDQNITESSNKTSSSLKVNPWTAKAMKAGSKSKKISYVEEIVRESLNNYEPKRSFYQPVIVESDRNSLNDVTRKSRRAVGGISYKEPSLCSKLRREDVIEKQKARLSGKVVDG